MRLTKISLIVLSSIMVLLACACAVEGGDKYHLELEIRAVADSMKFVYLRAGEQLEEPIYMGLDTDRDLLFTSRVLIINNKTKTEEFCLILQPLVVAADGYYLEEYDIVDDSGSIIETSLGSSMDMHYQTIRDGYLALKHIAGTHRFTFKVPALSAYGIDETFFNFSLLVEKDEREDKVEIVMDSSVEYEKLESDYFRKGNDCHDVYYCKGYPVFRVKVKNSDELIYDGLNDGLHIAFRKLYEGYLYRSTFSQITESGVYLCYVHYVGTKNYRAVNYYCYIIM